MKMISPEVNPNVPSGLQTTASTSNSRMMIANKQQQNQSLAENSVQRWYLQAFTLPCHVEKIAITVLRRMKW